jgi:hypothetical protein
MNPDVPIPYRLTPLGERSTIGTTTLDESLTPVAAFSVARRYGSGQRGAERIARAALAAERREALRARSIGQAP